MNPTALVPGAGKDLLDRLPEAERAVADREVGCDLKTTPPDVDEEFAPALRALPHPGLEADEFLLALRGGSNQHKHAFGALFHSRLQVDAVRPHVHITPRREIALLPGVVFGLPAVSRAITAGDRLGASLPSRAARASWKSPVDTPRR